MESEHYPDLPTRSGSFRAVVRAGDSVTSYHRAGAGRPVVLLRRPASEHPGWCTITEGIAAAGFRTITPEDFPEGEGFGHWLREFLDGLGLFRISLVTDEAFGVPAIGFALLEPDRVDRLVLLSAAIADTAVVDGALGDGLQAASHPLLLVRSDRPLEEMLTRVVRFLAGDPLVLD